MPLHLELLAEFFKQQVLVGCPAVFFEARL
jgi:hypothetical protein